MEHFLNFKIWFATTCQSSNFSPVCTDALPKNSTTVWKDALNLTFGVLGAVAILIVVLAGMRLVFARDNPESITKSRNTVVYASIGLVIIASAAAIVNFIIGRLGT